MKVDVTNNIQQLKISNVDRLDLVNVYLEDLEEGKGRIIIECWGSVWCKFWGGMGKLNIKDFFLQANNEYLTEKLAPTLRGNKRKYLIRIIETVKEALKTV